MAIPTRTWCATLRYPDKEEFLFGSVNMPQDATHHELLEAITRDAESVLPEGFKIIDMLPGQLIWHPEEDE